ncbi:MAG: endonuclease III, partial [Nitriliruptoraceae bacterium]
RDASGALGRDEGDVMPGDASGALGRDEGDVMPGDPAGTGGLLEIDHLRGKTVRAPVILDALRQTMPDATIALDFSNVWELLVATMLSAQSTDVKVNEVTIRLFAELPGPEAVASASLDHLEQLIGQLGLFRQKAKNLQATARLILECHGGEVPATMEELTALPGVARKTANVVLSNGFGINVGVVVDTHVTRLARRLRFTRHEDPRKIEQDLMRLFPRDQWLEVSDLLIHHGRRVCDARRPRCEDCVIEPACPSSQEAGLTDKR